MTVSLLLVRGIGMDQNSHWFPTTLVLLAVLALAATTSDGIFLDAVLLVVAVGLLIAGHVLRGRARRRLIYQCDRDDKEHRRGPADRAARKHP